MWWASGIALRPLTDPTENSVSLQAFFTLPIMTNDTKEKAKVSSFMRNAKLLNCGIISGLAQAAVFNPWDRALYLSVMYHRPFLRSENFVKPMAGVMQTIMQRAISSGLYFPLEDIFTQSIINNVKDANDPNHQRSIRFVAGLLAGSVNGLLMNPFSSVKFYYWGKAECGKESFYATAKDMYMRGGVRCFFVGSSATIIRDLIFGGFFALCRHEQLLLIRHRNGEIKQPSAARAFVVNAIAASTATLLSSPLNYVRVVHYATPPDVAPQSASQILKELVHNARNEPTVLARLSYVQSRLRLGWGTARVGFGMAFSATLYNLLSKAVT